MIGIVQVLLKTINCEHHHPALKALQQKKIVDEMQRNPALSLNTHTCIKRMVRLYRQEVQQYFSAYKLTWLIWKTNTFLCPESQTVIE